MITKAATTVNPLRILVVDDDGEFRKLVIETLGSDALIRVVQCSSLATVQRLKKEDRQFDVCILDVLFHQEVNQYLQIARFIRAESPKALIFALSNYVGNLSNVERELTNASLLKPLFRGSRDLLLKGLISLIESSESILGATKKSSIAHFRGQEKLAKADEESADQVKMRELLEITGSVQQVYGPMVEVVVLDLKVDGKPVAEGERPKSVLMPKTMFAAKNLLGTFTQFRYRYWEEEGKRIAEVFPQENPTGTLLPDDPALEKLLPIQKRQQKKQRSHA